MGGQEGRGCRAGVVGVKGRGWWGVKEVWGGGGQGYGLVVV